MTRIELIGCECSSSAIGAVERCQHRVADGSLWAIGATRFDQGAEWTDCTTDEALLVQSSCEFSECERPPPSFCTLSQTCHELGCNTWEFDAHACRRKDCQHDEECPADERCTAVPGCLNNFSCWSENGQCGCGGPEPCNMGYLCNPVATAGPRGTWSRFEIVQGAGPCPPGGSCTWDWVVTPDGEVTSSKQGDAGAQMILDPWRLRMALDGPEFRLGMQNGFQCDLPPTDVSVTFKVVIDGVSIQQDVTGCAISGPADNVAQALFDMLKNY
jgi:hypothetical protein